MRSAGTYRTIALIGLIVAGIGTLTNAEPLEGIESHLSSIPGKVNVDSRLRYEVFDQSGGLDVDGISHRIRYGYTTPEQEGITAMVEGETLYAWGHGADLHPADNAGDGTDLNQLWLAYRNEELGQAKVGRQVYTLDDHRFIGHVGWRQNIQTFDALTAQVEPMEKIVLRGFLIDGVNTVTAAHHDVEAHGINGSYQLTDSHVLTAFYYSLQGREDLAVGSNDTAGIRFTGSAKSGEFTWKYAFSYARQWENNDYPGQDFSHDYAAADVSANFDWGSLGAGYERLGGNGAHGFTTPLATLHKFNGFADVFLGASAGGGLVNGLKDTYIFASLTLPVAKGIRVQSIYHWFSPSRGEGDYGTEIDLVVGYSLTERLSLLSKYGDYKSDGGSGGVGGSDKRMYTLEMNFIY